MEDLEIKKVFSANLVNLRKSRNLTQLQLADKLNYSDKSVSKWEHGDVLPDIVTLTKLSEFFDITIDDLIGKKLKKKPYTQTQKRIYITFLSIGLTFFIASIVFLMLTMFSVKYAWLTFIYACLVASIVAVVFSCLWYNVILKCLSVSLLGWTFGLSIYLSLLVFLKTSQWFIFIICTIFQFLILLFFNYKHKSKESEESVKE